MSLEKIPVVIFAGGLGTRIAVEGDLKPKPMLEVGERPILWHIMKYYASAGAREFIICLGHKGDYIRDYFLNYHTRNVSLSLDLGAQSGVQLHDFEGAEDWRITLVETGRTTMTGERLRRVRDFVGDRTFMLTYGDGLSDVDLDALLDFHRSHEGFVTLTAVHPTSRFGLVIPDSKGKVVDFSEKPVTEDWINGGYFVLEPQVFSYLDKDEPFEQTPMRKLTENGALFSYQHQGFWKPVDTQRELKEANDLWDSGEAPWKKW